MKRALGLLRARVLALLWMIGVCAAATALVYQGGTAQGQAAQAMAADAQPGIALPVIMYHSVLHDPQRSGPYVVTPAQFEKDMRYLKEQGYTTVLPTELIRYVQGEGELPEKPVLVTFDDGYYNNLAYALPILQRLDMKAAVSVVGSYTDVAEQRMDQNPAYAHLNWEDIGVMASSGYVEIISHSYALHTNRNGREGVKKKPGEDEAVYEAALLQDIELQKEALLQHCGISTAVFAYPFGQWDKYSEALLRKAGFSMTMTCRERMNYIERDPASLFRLGRYNRPYGPTTQAFMQRALEG